MSIPLVVSFGGGVNSAAMLIGMRDRGIKPDLILFADTGGEKPETYRFLQIMRAWMFGSWGRSPDLIVVKNDGMHGELERECLTNNTLPSIVFGFRSCSDKYKIRPQKKYAKSIFGDQELRWAVGIDASEAHRQGVFKDCWHPLVEWGWDRDDCIRAIEGQGIWPPVKSACFFCPSSKKHEVLKLRADHPELFARAVAMEKNATKATTAKGLGRHWSWEQLVAADESQFKLIPEAPQTPCVCFDGEPEAHTPTTATEVSESSPVAATHREEFCE